MGRLSLYILFLAALMAIGSDGLIRKVVKEVKRVVRKVNREVKRVGRDLNKIVAKPLKAVVKVLGRKKVKIHERYETFSQTASRIVQVNQKEYRVEEIKPCPDGKHNIVKAETPIEIIFGDGVIKMQDTYCTKCGQHFYTDPKRDEL